MGTVGKSKLLADNKSFRHRAMEEGKWRQTAVLKSLE